MKQSMTELQKEQARHLRSKGVSLGKIAQLTGLTKNVVSSSCKSICISTDENNIEQEMQAGIACAFCGDILTQPKSSGRRRRFCCTACRRKYWTIHRSEQRQRKEAIHVMNCAFCGRTFEVYGNRKRKYCCHEHYLMHRNGCKVDKSVA